MHIVNTLEEARACLRGAAAQQPVPLASPPFAACYAGVNYYRALVDALTAEFPTTQFTFTLDCGNDAAIAFEAQRMGFAQVRYTLPT